ncbi:MAG TPA: thiamine pyrophosphate-dependent enzyme [Thermoanaerobaculia bacterium]|nr:thiamine pyrophosphate-dependent enzyme [Thermoanaerobaculia bacterium]
MSKTAAEIMIETLIDWGVETIFGIPGDGINGIMEALRTHQEQIRFIQVRHEEAAAFMACAHAKYTGGLGVCLATSGPGGIHLLNGLYDAKLDGQPVLAITGHHYHDLIGTFSQQDVDLDKLFENVAHYSVRVMGAAHVENVTSLACRIALARRCVTHLNFPVDLQDQKGNGDRSKRNRPHHVSDVLTIGGNVPEEDDLRAAAAILNGGKKIAMLVGRGALDAGDEVEQIADLLASPVIKALLGKGVIPDESPFTTGGIGLLGTKPSEEAMMGCDTLLIVGSSFPYMEFMPKPGQARAVQIDADPVRIGLRYPVDVGLVGDAKKTLARLAQHLNRKQDRGFLEKAQAGMKEWWELMKEREGRDDTPMKPQRLAAAVSRHLKDNAIVSCDSGTITTWFARHIKARRGQLFSLSGTLATMACGIPYTNAAQLAYPDRQCIAIVGDGGATMLIGELATAVKYKLPVKIFIIKNNALGQIKWEQMVMLGNPEYGCELQPIDFTSIARGFGFTAFHLQDPGECEDVVAKAMAIAGPVLIEAVVDPFEAPMPPKVKAEQAVKFAESLARGEVDRKKIIATLTEDKIKEMV